MSNPAAQAVLQIIMGAWATQAVGALCRVRAFDALAGGPAAADVVAARCALDPDATHRVLRACAMLGVVREVAPRTFALTEVGELLRSDTSGSMRALVDAETAPGHWLPWGRLDDVLRTGKPAVEAALGSDIWRWYAEHPAEGEAFSAGMGGLSAAALGAIDASYAPPAARRIVDVGGAHGAFLAWALGKLPGATGVLFDLPHVVGTAGPALEQAGVAARVERVGGDFFVDVPQGGDLYLLKHVVHDWNDDEVRRILGNVRRAMAPGANVLIVEMLLPEQAGVPSPAILLDLNMLVMLSGRERTVSELRALFASAGLVVTKVVPTPSPFAVIEARAA